METTVYTVAFHGGTEVVEKPEIRKGLRHLDFGVGFYTTQSREQAARDAIRAFYRSRLYELLGNRETGLWHASTDMLLDLYEGERKTGTLNLDWCI